MNINLDLTDFRAFVAVYDLRNFRQAAEAIHLSQPALSRRIAGLETNFGQVLFERSTRHVSPTSFGRRIEPMIRRLLDEFQTSLAEISGIGNRQSKHITIACVPTAAFYFLPRVIEQFNEQYPEVLFRILDLSASDGLESVASGQAEFGLNFIGASEAGLSFTPLRDDPYVLACRHDHPLAQRASVTWRELVPEKLIGVSRSSGNRMLLDAALGKQGVHLTWQFEVDHLTTSLGLVEAGLGVSIVPRIGAPQGDHPILRVCLIADPEVSRTVGIVQRQSGSLSAPAQRFRDMLLDHWGDKVGGDKVDGHASPLETSR